MAPSSFSLLLRHIPQPPKPHYHLHRHLLSPLIKHFSASSPQKPTSDAPKPSSLSARLSFVFEKIDEIESERSEKDEALQRIRAWRESKKKPNQPNDDSNSSYGANLCNVENKSESLELGFSGEETNSFGGNVRAIEGNEGGKKVGLMKREIELAHPWPEWIALMERLVQQNYFDHRRKDEDQMIEGLGSIDVSKFAEEEGFDFTRDWRTVQPAVVNFAKDRFDIFRSLSRQDIQTFVGFGCPSTDKKVVFSAKLLRKHAHLDEGDVCSSCSLRTNCERAYLVTNKEDEARTIDVMRVLLTYGFDPINGSVENKSLLKHKSVKQVVRKLLREVVRLSAVPIDPNLPPPVIKKRPPKVKQPPPPPKRRVGRDDIEMKKGDWLCPKCNFMNFAKNSVCLQCDAKRPKRQLLPGEWECPQCNFLNYRRNMTCFNCEHKRPPDEYSESQMQGRQQRPATRAERVPDREQLSNAWNFDFDDDESDGADVAAFEYADARTMNEDHHLDSLPEDGTFNRPQDNRYEASRASRFQDKEPARPVQTKHSVGFDDFDDEDDDVDSYELDNQNRTQRQEASSLHFSDVENEGYSDDGNDDIPGFSGAKTRSYPKSSKSLHQKRTLSDSGDDGMDFDSDEDLPVHPKWKTSHVADTGRRNKASRGPSSRMSFDSDEDDKLVFGSDDDINNDFNSRQRRGSYYDSDAMDFRRGEKSKQNRFEGRQGVNFVKGSNFDDDFDRSSRGSRGSPRGTFDNARGRQSMSGGSHGSHRGKFDNARGRQSMDGDSRGSHRDKYDNGDYHGSQRSKFDNASGRQWMDGGSRGRPRGKFDNGDSRGSQRGKYDNARGRQSMRGDSHSSQRGGKYDDGCGRQGTSDFSEPRQPRAGRGGRRSNDSDNTWSDHDRPLRQR